MSESIPPTVPPAEESNVSLEPAEDDVPQEVIDDLLKNPSSLLIAREKQTRRNSLRVSISKSINKTWRRTTSGRWSLGRKPVHGDEAFESQNPMFDPFNANDDIMFTSVRSDKPGTPETDDGTELKPSETETKVATDGIYGTTVTKEGLEALPECPGLYCSAGHRMEFFESQKAQVWCCVCTVNLMKPRTDTSSNDSDSDASDDKYVEPTFGCQTCAFRVCLRSCYSAFFQANDWVNILKRTHPLKWREAFNELGVFSTRFDESGAPIESAAAVPSNTLELVGGGDVAGTNNNNNNAIEEEDSEEDNDSVNEPVAAEDVLNGILSEISLLSSETEPQPTPIEILQPGEAPGEEFSTPPGRLELVLLVTLWYGMSYDIDIFAWTLGALRSGKDDICDTKWVLSVLFSSFCGIAKYLPSRVQTVMMDMLKDDKRVDPTICKSRCIWLAARNNDTGLVKHLLNDGRANPGGHTNYSIGKAAEFGNLELLKLLLKHPKANPADSSNYCIRFATQGKHYQAMKLLLDDPRVNPADNDDYAIWVACDNGDVEAVRILMADARVDPSTDESAALYAACSKGCLEIVKILFDDGRVDATEGLALQAAAGNGHLDVVKYLLTLPQVNAQEDKSALHEATKEGHLEVVKELVVKANMEIDYDDVEVATRANQVEVVRFFFDHGYVANNNELRDLCYAGLNCAKDESCLELYTVLFEKWDSAVPFPLSFMNELISDCKDNELVKIALNHPNIWFDSDNFLVPACKSKSLERVKYVLAFGYQIETYMLRNLFEVSTTEIVQYLLEYPGFINKILEIDSSISANRRRVAVSGAISNRDPDVLKLVLSVEAPKWSTLGPPIPYRSRTATFRDKLRRGTHQLTQMVERTPPIRIHWSQAVANTLTSSDVKLFVAPIIGRSTNPMSPHLANIAIVTSACRVGTVDALKTLFLYPEFQDLDVSCALKRCYNIKWACFDYLIDTSARYYRHLQKLKLETDKAKGNVTSDSKAGCISDKKDSVVNNTKPTECHAAQVEQDNEEAATTPNIEIDEEALKTVPRLHVNPRDLLTLLLSYTPPLESVKILFRHPLVMQIVEKRIEERNKKKAWYNRAMERGLDLIRPKDVGFVSVLHRIACRFGKELQLDSLKLLFDVGYLAFDMEANFNSLIRLIALKGMQPLLTRFTATYLANGDGFSTWQFASNWWLPFELGQGEEMGLRPESNSPLWYTEQRMIAAFKEYPALYTIRKQDVETPENRDRIHDVYTIVEQWEEVCRTVAQVPEVRFKPFGPTNLPLAYHMEYPAVLRALAPLENEGCILGGLCLLEQMASLNLSQTEVVWEILETYCPLFVKPTEQDVQDFKTKLEIADSERLARELEEDMFDFDDGY